MALLTRRRQQTAESRWKRYKKHKYLFILLLPALIWYTVFQYAPLYGVQLAFKDFRVLEGINGSPWVGFKHFEVMFTSTSQFWRVFRNTVVISLYHIIFGFPAAIVLALIFNEIRGKVFKRVTQSISYLPHFLSWVILAGLFGTILSPSTGIVNYVLTLFGLDTIYFLGDPAYFRFTLVVTSIWKEVGWGTIIYLAALASINPSLYEAASIDGAGRWKQTLHITLPSILPVVCIMFIFQISGILDAGFDQILNLYHPAVYEVADILDTYVFRVGLSQMQYSLTTAVGLFKNVIALSLVLGTDYLIKKAGQEGLF
ncbi:ABC transporter permease [Paenibacillus sp. GXUN7292]|uniref:ABC transporter permease n=1 Tax=Paenibacillus sp. GXUN7292 TaxID=3422499 RepID=UPI003D7DFEFB